MSLHTLASSVSYSTHQSVYSFYHHRTASKRKTHEHSVRWCGGGRIATFHTHAPQHLDPAPTVRYALIIPSRKATAIANGSYEYLTSPAALELSDGSTVLLVCEWKAPAKGARAPTSQLDASAAITSRLARWIIYGRLYWSTTSDSC